MCIYTCVELYLVLKPHRLISNLTVVTWTWTSNVSDYPHDGHHTFDYDLKLNRVFYDQ